MNTGIQDSISLAQILPKTLEDGDDAIQPQSRHTKVRS
jgi:hypothetical protein